MPKIKEIKEANVTLTAFTPTMQQFFKSISASSFCADIEYHPKTKKSALPKTIKLAVLELNEKLAPNQNATIDAAIAKQAAQKQTITKTEIAQNVYLVGEYGDAEKEFAQIFKELQDEFEPTEKQTESTEIPTKKERKSRKEKETEVDNQ